MVFEDASVLSWPPSHIPVSHHQSLVQAVRDVDEIPQLNCTVLLSMDLLGDAACHPWIISGKQTLTNTQIFLQRHSFGPQTWCCVT